MVVVFPAGAAAALPCNFKNPQFALVLSAVVVPSFYRRCPGDGSAGHGQKPHLSFFMVMVVERLHSDRGKKKEKKSLLFFPLLFLPLPWFGGEQIINVPRLRNKRSNETDMKLTSDAINVFFFFPPALIELYR